ncbi:hypothetical protein AB0I68_26835 [Streptomyces sp. NPDC050448]
MPAGRGAFTPEAGPDRAEAGPALAEDSVLRHWVTTALAFGGTLPPK